MTSLSLGHVDPSMDDDHDAGCGCSSALVSSPLLRSVIKGWRSLFPFRFCSSGFESQVYDPFSYIAHNYLARVRAHHCAASLCSFTFLEASSMLSTIELRNFSLRQYPD